MDWLKLLLLLAQFLLSVTKLLEQQGAIKQGRAEGAKEAMNEVIARLRDARRAEPLPDGVPDPDRRD